MIRLTIRQMEYFEALAETLHFGRAAGFAGVSQPALSAQIAEMEERLGRRLFERGGRSVRLTEEAKALKPRIERVLAEIRDIEAAARRGRAPMEGRFRLGVIPTVAPYLLPRLLPLLKERFPALVLELREAVTATLIDETVAGRLDGMIAALPLDNGALVAEPLFRDRFFLAVPADDPGFAAPPVAPESPALERLMLLEDGHCMRNQALEICTAARRTALANYGAASLTTLLQMVAHGQGVTLVPEMALAAGVASSGVRAVPFSEQMPARMLAFAWRRSAERGDECRQIAGVMRTLSGAPEEMDGEHGPQRDDRDEADDEGRLAVADAVGGDVDGGMHVA
jgi:LysR family hydrogen peroxide-inducible transcriptional activator